MGNFERIARSDFNDRGKRRHVQKSMIHPTAIIDPHAKIGPGVKIGPYAVIGPNVEIGEERKLWHMLSLTDGLQ